MRPQVPRDFEGWAAQCQLVSGPEHWRGDQLVGSEPYVRRVPLPLPLPGIVAKKANVKMLGNAMGYMFRVGTLDQRNTFVIQRVDVPGKPDFWLGCGEHPQSLLRVLSTPLWNEDDTAFGPRDHDQPPLTFRELRDDEPRALGEMIMSAAHQQPYLARWTRNLIERTQLMAEGAVSLE